MEGALIPKSNVDELRPYLEDGVYENLENQIKSLATDVQTIDVNQNLIQAASIKKGGKLTWPELQALFKRGNDFNAKCNRYWFNRGGISEVNLIDKKRLDTYLPPINGNAGMIISRKATTLSDIQLTTFENYLKEIEAKYFTGKGISSSKTNLQNLEGDYYLEIPESNRIFYESNLEMQRLAAPGGATKNGVKIIYQVE